MINRRNFLKTTLAVGTSTILPSFAWAEQNFTRVALWKETPPGGGGPKGAMHINPWGSVRNIVTPMIDLYLPTGTPKAAMLVAAGGGYTQISIKREAVAAANWLTARGIAAAVLYYRLPKENWNAGALAPLQDAQRALRMLNSGKLVPGIAKKRIGVLGFSAGGHLMAMASVCPTFKSYPAEDAIDNIVPQAAFSALAYPVITVEPPYDNTSTKKVLVGKTPTPQQSAFWSVQTHVTKSCPPTFLVHALNDPISNQQNTAIMEAACKKVGVPVERHVFPSGGHGFSMGQPNSPTANWPLLLEKWLKRNSII